MFNVYEASIKCVLRTLMVLFGYFRESDINCHWVTGEVSTHALLIQPMKLSVHSQAKKVTRSIAKYNQSTSLTNSTMCQVL